MTYKTKPSEFYTSLSDVRDFLTSRSLEAIDFRPTQRGDLYIAYSWEDKLTLYDHPKDCDFVTYAFGLNGERRQRIPRTPRLIVKSMYAPGLETIWE